MKLKKFESETNKYTIISEIDAGGNSFVELVKDENGNEYAAKFLIFKDDEDNKIPKAKLERFNKEIEFQKTIGLDKKNIVHIIDSGCYNERYHFYIMKKYDCNFSYIIKDNNDYVFLLKLFLDICYAVRYIHNKGHYHRDLKPENFFYDRSNNKLMLGDFGITHFKDSVTTKPNEKLCNERYAAPEQRKDSTFKPGKHSDIYSLGLILNEIFTKSVPTGMNYKTISDIDPVFGSLLDPWIEKMLDFDPKKRPISLTHTINLITNLINNYKNKYDFVRTSINNYNEIPDNCDLVKNLIGINHCLNNQIKINSSKIIEYKNKVIVHDDFLEMTRIIEFKNFIQNSIYNGFIPFSPELELTSNDDKVAEYKTELIRLINEKDIIYPGDIYRKYACKMLDLMNENQLDKALNYFKNMNINSVMSLVDYYEIWKYIIEDDVFVDTEICSEIFIDYSDIPNEIVKRNDIENDFEFLLPESTLLFDSNKYKLLYGNKRIKEYILDLLNDRKNYRFCDLDLIKGAIEYSFEDDSVELGDYEIKKLHRILKENKIMEENGK